MKTSIRRAGLSGVLAVTALAAAAPIASAEQAVAVTSFGPQRVVSFDTATPGSLQSSVTIRGLQRSELVTGIDLRPRGGGILATTNQNRVAGLDPSTGVLTALPNAGARFSIDVGLDFNPTVDRLRYLTSSDTNRRINPDTGAVAMDDTPLAYAADDRNAGSDAQVSATAYSNNVDGATSTVQYGLDTGARRQLVIVSPPNDGVLRSVGSFGVNSLGETGFDISGATGDAYAVLTPSSPRTSRLYRINLETGAATQVGQIGTGGRFRALTIVPNGQVELLFDNDPESRLLRVAETGATAQYGGAARHVELFQQLEAATRARVRPGGVSLLKLNGGDNFLPGLEFLASREERFPENLPPYDSIVLDTIGFDALAIGNHEFDFGPDVFRRFLEGFAPGTKFVSSNLDATGEPTLKPFVDNGTIVRSVVVQKGSQRFGVVGATPPELPSITSPGGVTVSAVRPAVQAEIDRLRDQGVSRIVMTSQLQSITNDRSLANSLRGIDIMVSGGGQETQASAGDPLVPGDSRTSVGGTPLEFPLETTNADGDQVRIVTTNGFYKYVGRLVTEFDALGRLVDHDDDLSKPFRVSGNSADADVVAPDEFITENVTEPVQAFINEFAMTILATSDVPLDGRRPDPIRRRENGLGNLIADAQLFETRRQAAAAGDPLPVIAIQNSGGIRNGSIIPAGDLSRATTFAVLPFTNLLTQVQVTPAQLKQLLEVTVGANGGSTLNSQGEFPQISGFRFTYDRNGTGSGGDMPLPNGDGNATPNDSDPGSRIRNVTLDDGTAIIVGGVVAPGAPSSIRLAVNDFAAEGGDDYPLEGLPITRYGATYLDALERFLTTPVADGGLQREGADVTAAEYPEAGEGRIRDVTPAPAT